MPRLTQFNQLQVPLGEHGGCPGLSLHWGGRDLKGSRGRDGEQRPESIPPVCPPDPGPKSRAARASPPSSVSQFCIPAPYPSSVHPGSASQIRIPRTHPGSVSTLHVPAVPALTSLLRIPVQHPNSAPAARPSPAQLSCGILPPTSPVGGTAEAPAPPGTGDPHGWVPPAPLPALGDASAGDIPAAAMETRDAVALATEAIWVPTPPPPRLWGARSRGRIAPQDRASRGTRVGTDTLWPCPEEPGTGVDARGAPEAAGRRSRGSGGSPPTTGAPQNPPRVSAASRGDVTRAKSVRAAGTSPG